jgi:hypothetical protein
VLIDNTPHSYEAMASATVFKQFLSRTPAARLLKRDYGASGARESQISFGCFPKQIRLQFPPSMITELTLLILEGVSRGNKQAESNLHRLYQFRDYLESCLAANCLARQGKERSIGPRAESMGRTAN